MITAENEERTLTRNASHFKPISKNCYDQATKTTDNETRQWVRFEKNANMEENDNEQTGTMPITPFSQATPTINTNNRFFSETSELNNILGPRRSTRIRDGLIRQ